MIIKRLISVLVLTVCALRVAGQSYHEQIDSFRLAYKRDFLTDDHSPLKAADTGFLRFYEPDAKYRVKARFSLTKNSKSFDMATHSGKTKKYRQYGTATFSLGGKNYTLAIYQGLDLIKNPALRDYLFIPFNDLTNYETTYAGGRYLDMRLGAIKEGSVMLDFNKCYNPYCAFAEGYSCPIPPDENKLQVRIEAGEQMFGKQHE